MHAHICCVVMVFKFDQLPLPCSYAFFTSYCKSLVLYHFVQYLLNITCAEIPMAPPLPDHMSDA